MRGDGIKLDGKAAAESFGVAARGFGRAGGQIPIGDLLLGDRYTLEHDARSRCQFTQRFLDLLTGIDAGRIEVAEMVDVDRSRRCRRWIADAGAKIATASATILGHRLLRRVEQERLS